MVEDNRGCLLAIVLNFIIWFLLLTLLF
ncbi:Not available [Clostridium perfringens]|nr:Not available [Clostridium perfringens]